MKKQSQEFILSLNFEIIVSQMAAVSGYGENAMIKALRDAFVAKATKPNFDLILFLDFKSIVERCVTNHRFDLNIDRAEAIKVLKAEFILLAKQFDRNLSKSKSL